MKEKPGMALTILAGLPKPKGKRAGMEDMLEDEEEFDDLAAEDEEMDAESEDEMEMLPEDEELDPMTEESAGERAMKAVADGDVVAFEIAIEEMFKSFMESMK